MKTLTAAFPSRADSELWKTQRSSLPEITDRVVPGNAALGLAFPVLVKHSNTGRSRALVRGSSDLRCLVFKSVIVKLGSKVGYLESSRRRAWNLKDYNYWNGWIEIIHVAFLRTLLPDGHTLMILIVPDFHHKTVSCNPITISINRYR